MKKIEILGRSVSIDTDQLSKGLCELHNEDENKKAVLAFGMLDFQLCEMFNKMVEEAIIKEFSTVAYTYFKKEIDTFIKDCQNEINKGVYKYAKLIV